MDQSGSHSSSSSSSSSAPTIIGAALSRARLNFLPSSASSSSSSSSSGSAMPTKEDISRYRALLFDLLLNTIPKRKKSVMGRFDKYETARKDYIDNVALPNLQYGKFPTDEDDRILFMEWHGGEKPAASTKQALDAFKKKYHRDPRSSKDALSAEEQSATFAAVSESAREAYKKWRGEQVSAATSAAADADDDAVLLAQVDMRGGGQIHTQAESEAYVRRFTMVDEAATADVVAEVPAGDDADCDDDEEDVDAEVPPENDGDDDGNGGRGGNTMADEGGGGGGGGGEGDDTVGGEGGGGGSEGGTVVSQGEATHTWQSQFLEQKVGGTRLQLDHSKKFLARMLVNGVRTHPNLLTIMNEWGGIVID